VYHDADISLLDDCLSAVDAHVGRDLFEECLVKVLLGRDAARGSKPSKKTVVLVTNSLQYLSHPSVDRIVVLEHGKVVESGSYKELSSIQGSRFELLLGAFKDTMSGDFSNEKGEEPLKSESISSEQTGNLSEKSLRSKGSPGSTGGGLKLEDRKKTKLMSDEMAERDVGKVSKEVYLAWMNAAGGYLVIPALFIVYAMGEAITIFSNWWLTYWSHAASTSRESQVYFLGIYGIINVTAIFTLFVRQIMVILFSVEASKTVRMHSEFSLHLEILFPCHLLYLILRQNSYS
jgi:hypothetical protein